MTTKTISIAMTTYNGSLFIQEQLESLENQTHIADELIVGDDNSTDRSATIFDEFAPKSKMKIRVTKNPVNLGFGRNFAQTLLRCTGDYIFFCDQDDWWNSDKVAVCLAELEKCTVPSIVTHDAWLADADLKSSGRTLCQQFIASGVANPGDLTYGCCIGFDSFFTRFFEPDHSHSHDTWLFDIGRLLDARKHIDQPLILYRRHEKNATESHATSLSRTSSWQRRWSRLKSVLRSDIRGEVGDQLTLTRDLLVAFERNAAATIETFGLQRFSSAIAVLVKRRSYLESRANLLKSSRLSRPWRIVKFRRSGGYSEGSSLGMIRDLFA